MFLRIELVDKNLILIFGQLLISLILLKYYLLFFFALLNFSITLFIFL